MAPEAQRAVRPTDGSTTILLVEDEVLVRLVTADHLRSLGHRVLEAADGSEAVRLLAADEAIDLLLTDVGLPGAMNGFAIARHARERRPDLVVVVTSGSELASHPATDLAAGYPYIRKPYDLGALARELRRLAGWAGGSRVRRLGNGAGAVVPVTAHGPVHSTQ